MRHHDSISSTRRAVIAGLAAATASAAAAAPVKVARSDASPSRPLSAPLRHAGLADWRGLASSTFTVAAEAGACAMTLVAVHPLPSEGPRARGCTRDQAFAAVFQLASTGPAPAGNRRYRFDHRDHGPVDLFVGPLSMESGRPRVTAIFN